MEAFAVCLGPPLLGGVLVFFGSQDSVFWDILESCHRGIFGICLLAQPFIFFHHDFWEFAVVVVMAVQPVAFFADCARLWWIYGK
jgi:hypothetical protein